MNELILKGRTTVAGMEVPNIEGGFGKGKKCMLANDIIDLHDVDTRTFNQAIKRKLDKFEESVDYINIADTDFAITLCDSGIISQNALNASSYIFLFSERGYMKVIGKILDDDKSWEIYQELIDNYFRMRKQIKEEKETLSPNNAVKLMEMLDDDMKKLDIDTHSKLATKKALLEYSGMEVPLTIPAPTEDKFISITEIARQVGIYSTNDNPHAQATSYILNELDIDDDLITITSGSNGNYTYPQTQYSESVVDLVNNWLDAEGYPEVINGNGKNYNVVYR